MENDLRTKLNTDLKEALRSGDRLKLSVVRMILAAVKNAEMARQEKLMSAFLREHQVAATDDEAARQAKLAAISKEAERVAPQAKLTDNDIIGVIAKEAKQREESIAAYKQGNRADLVAQEEAELAVLRSYLPKQATRDEIVAEVKKIIAETGAQGQRDRGKVMPRAIASLKGRAEGREINEVVSELLK